MMIGPTHLQCPVCAHAFMSVQSRPDGNETCPHCAFVGPRTHYRALTQPLGAQPVRFQKRVPRPHEPLPEQSAAAVPPEAPHQPQVQVMHMSHPTHQPRMTPAAWPGMGAPPQGSQPEQGSAIEPQKKSTRLFWVTATLLFIAVCIFTGMLVKEKINQRARNLHATKNTAPAPTSGHFSIPAARVNPMEELNQRVLTGAAMSEADRLIKVLFNSPTTADRLKAIANPEEHQAEVAAMFEGGTTKPALVALTPITNPPLSLLTRQRLPMFKVVTTVNRSGALISTLADASGATVISWPLFRETHDGLLAGHIETKNQAPKWFHVGLRRFHSFDLPKNISADFDAIDIDGSTDGTGHIVTYVAKESPLGRHFAKSIEWNKFYFGRVLVSWMDIGGEMRPVLLDCEGSTLPNPNRSPDTAR